MQKTKIMTNTKRDLNNNKRVWSRKWSHMGGKSGKLSEASREVAGQLQSLAGSQYSEKGGRESAKGTGKSRPKSRYGHSWGVRGTQQHAGGV